MDPSDSSVFGVVEGRGSELGNFWNPEPTLKPFTAAARAMPWTKIQAAMTAMRADAEVDETENDNAR